MSPAEEQRLFELAYSEHSRSVLRYLQRRVSDSRDAADLLAEVYLVAWRKRPGWPAENEWRPWLFKVAHFLLQNHYRSTLRHQIQTEPLTDDAATHTGFADAGFTGAGFADAVEQRDSVRNALTALGAEDRELLTLTAWDGLSPSEIAIVLDLPATTVRVRLHRARSRFRELYDAADSAALVLTKASGRG